MNRITFFLLFFGFTISSFAQDIIGEEVQQNIAAFGYCIMPNNTSILTLEADYDGMYFTERDMVDFFETGRFRFSEDLVDWTYYDYWVLNNRTAKQPEEHMFYKMVVDPTGTYFALAEENKDGWSSVIKIFNKSSQTFVTEFDCKTANGNIDYLNQVRFDAQGKNLLIGAKEQGIYSFNLENKQISEVFPPNKYQLYDYDYTLDTPILKAYEKTSDGDYVLDPDLFTLSNGIKQAVKLPLPLHFTRILTPTETHKYYGMFYEQDYDTYLAPIDDFNYQIVYRNKDLFKFRTREVPKE
ncbi:MAG: hypothetical protein KDC79_17550 [Cyclobacteriaceae bacterium]|nr:hypothetical protein [Cyclobacteriaceae bacterium]